MATSENDGRPILQARTVRGEPYCVGDRTLTPVARVIALGKAKGTVGRDSVSGWGGGFVHVMPLRLVEDTPDGERTVAIYDATSRMISGILAQVVALVLFLSAVRWFVRRRRATRTTE